MISDEVRKIIGEPWADGRDLKMIDRWKIRQNGADLHMDVYFYRQNNAESIIVKVVRWKKFLGHETDKSVYKFGPHYDRVGY